MYQMPFEHMIIVPASKGVSHGCITVNLDQNVLQFKGNILLHLKPRKYSFRYQYVSEPLENKAHLCIHLLCLLFYNSGFLVCTNLHCSIRG